MARKKSRQQDPNESSDSGDTNTGASAPTSACKHIGKAVQLNNVKKKLKGGIRSSCDSCASKKSKIANIVPDASLSNEEEAIDENWTYWLCLTCAHVGCGRGQYQHALAHYNTPRSESHDLVVDIEQWIVWCYTCELKMAMNSTKKLQECVEYIRRHIQASSKSAEDVASIEEVSITENVEFLKAPSTASSLEKDATANAGTKKSSDTGNITNNGSKVVLKSSKVRGLMNLGNTCFYNSVLQCLSVTPYLTKVLERLTVSGEEFIIPGDPKAEIIEAPPVSGILEKSGPLSSALLTQLIDLRNSDTHADVLRPQKLLKQVQDLFHQFRGNEQHDAHELLRHLLEGVRSDDLKRFQRVILRQHNLVGVKNAADDEKKKMKLYGQQLQDLILGVEGIFKGQLVSIVECQDCLHHSVRFESFLDLSLPVMEDKPMPPMRKKDQGDGFTSDSAPSKYQAKKAKKAAKRNSRANKARRNDKLDGCVTILEETAKGSDGLESEQSDADVEDNAEQDTGDAGDAAEGKEVVESGYSSEKHNTGESDGTSPSSMAAEGGCEASALTVSEHQPVVSTCAPPPYWARPAEPAEDWAPFHPRDARCKATLAAAQSDEDGSDEELRITIPESGEGSIHISPVQSSERPESRCDFADTDPRAGPRGSILLDLCRSLAGVEIADGNGNRVICPEDGKSEIESSDVGKETEVSPGGVDAEKKSLSSRDVLNTNEEKLNDDSGTVGHVSKIQCNTNDVSEWCKTLASRQQTEEGECSVISCLNQFTSLELMTGNNKVGCDACTQRQNKGGEGKTVYTNSTKQFLISSPPPVLILHLKRFMLENGRFKKLQRFVSFPLDLDIAPFCSTKCKESPSFEEAQAEVKYSLFGIVEHTGSLNIGHYVAYIKVRPSLGDSDPRWSFLPSTRNFVYPKLENYAKTTTNEVDEKWYSISDSRVVEIAESKVLKVQAYLLFYERIM